MLSTQTTAVTTDAPPMLPMLNEHQVADLLNIKVKTLRAWRQKKKGPRFARIGRSVRYRPEDVSLFIKSSVVSNEVGVLQ